MAACVRTRYQPANLLVSQLKKDMKQDGLGTVEFGNLLKVKQAEYAIAPSNMDLDLRAHQMSEKVEYLAGHGVEPVFFRMPTHPDLRHSPLSEAVERKLKEALHPDRYRWLDEFPEESATYDGTHLLIQSAREFSRKLCAAMASRPHP
jgi:hypothetical protein